MRDKTIALIAGLLALTLAAIGRYAPHEVARPNVEIGTPIQRLHNRDGAAARTTEPVRYDDNDIEILASYPVVDGSLVDDGRALARDRAEWATVARVLPASALRSISQLNLITDGPGDTLAMVHRSTRSGDRWILSIDVAEPRDVVEPTLIHELAHLMTLRRDDVTTNHTTCNGVWLKIGCARDGSVLADWHAAFWSGLSEPAQFDTARFVTDYAATSVSEDLAETFVEYVMSPEPAHPSVIAAKFGFFAARSDFVAARDEVRRNLGLR